MLHHIRNLNPIIGLSALESRIDSESFTQSAKIITISDACGDLSEASSPEPNADASDDTSVNKSSEEEVTVVLYHKGARGTRDQPQVAT